MAIELTPEPAISEGERPASDAAGVDLTLIRETLRMSPTERLKTLENYMNTLANVRVVRRASDGSAPG